MSTTTLSARGRAETDTSWLRLVQTALAVDLVCLLVFAYVGTFLTTITEGDFRYTADYWYTGVGLPISLAGIAIVLGLHRLQHGGDGRLGRIGLWMNTIALVEIFAQLTASLVTSSEVRWGPSYPICAALTFVGVALFAAGSWRAGLLPRWMLGLFPVVWLLGSFAAFGATPVVLAAFFVVLGLTLTRRVSATA
jgi:hypothetical protein